MVKRFDQFVDVFQFLDTQEGLTPDHIKDMDTQLSGTAKPVGPKHWLKSYNNGDEQMGKKVVIDEEECMGCEACIELAPDVFEFNSDSEKAVVIKAEGGDEEAIQEAIDSCPASCIVWE